MNSFTARFPDLPFVETMGGMNLEIPYINLDQWLAFCYGVIVYLGMSAFFTFTNGDSSSRELKLSKYDSISISAWTFLLTFIFFMVYSYFFSIDALGSSILNLFMGIFDGIYLSKFEYLALAPLVLFKKFILLIISSFGIYFTCGMVLTYVFSTFTFTIPSKIFESLMLPYSDELTEPCKPEDNQL